MYLVTSLLLMFLATSPGRSEGAHLIASPTLSSGEVLGWLLCTVLQPWSEAWPGRREQGTSGQGGRWGAGTTWAEGVEAGDRRHLAQHKVAVLAPDQGGVWQSSRPLGPRQKPYTAVGWRGVREGDPGRGQLVLGAQVGVGLVLGGRGWSGCWSCATWCQPKHSVLLGDLTVRSEDQMRRFEVPRTADTAARSLQR